MAYKTYVAEEIFNIWRREGIMAKNPSVPWVKDTSNFDNAKSKQSWKHFEMFASIMNRNSGLIDCERYIRFLSRQMKGLFNPVDLCSRKSIALYKKMLEAEKMESSPDMIEAKLRKSIVFIVNFCVERKLKSFEEYLMDDMEMIPSVFKHVSSGQVFFEVFACINEILKYTNRIPNDVLNEYFISREQFFHDNNRDRMRINNNERLKKLAQNFVKIVNGLILKSEQEKS